jgi:hypothetical protein
MLNHFYCIKAIKIEDLILKTVSECHVEKCKLKKISVLITSFLIR